MNSHHNELDALRQQLDDVWAQMNQPKTTARQMTACYRRAAELRRTIANLEQDGIEWKQTETA